MKLESKVEYLNKSIENMNNIKNKNVILEIKDLFGKDLNAYSDPKREKIYISPKLVEYLEKEELKSLMLHEYAHIILNHKSESWFWEYFFFKHLFLVYICSFSFNLEKTYYIVLGVLVSTLLSYIYFIARGKSKRSRKKELESDLFARKYSNKKNMISLLNKIDEIRKQDELNLDLVIAKFLFGSLHPKLKKRVNNIEYLK